LEEERVVLVGGRQEDPRHSLVWGQAVSELVWEEVDDGDDLWAEEVADEVAVVLVLGLSQVSQAVLFVSEKAMM
jgi:hypothetical protein